MVSEKNQYLYLPNEIRRKMHIFINLRDKTVFMESLNIYILNGMEYYALKAALISKRYL